jgi:hypothetical protein
MFSPLNYIIIIYPGIYLGMKARIWKNKTVVAYIVLNNVNADHFVKAEPERHLVGKLR